MKFVFDLDLEKQRRRRQRTRVLYKGYKAFPEFASFKLSTFRIRKSRKANGRKKVVGAGTEIFSFLFFDDPTVTASTLSL